ncbi:MAG: rhomboid family intramembrane serine protease [Rufibacter sp.]
MPPITPMVRNLLIINVLVFFATNKLFDASMFTLHDIRSEHFRPHQFITHMFLHADGRHLFGNMLTLFFFGPMLEHFWGGKRFLIFYFVTGVGASLLYSVVHFVEVSQMQDLVAAYLQNPKPLDLKEILDTFRNINYDPSYLVQFQRDPDNPTLIAETQQLAQRLYQEMVNGQMLGASGAIFGVLMAFGLLFPNTELMLLFIPFPIKAKYLVLLFGAYELYGGLVRAPGDNVAHYAHLGGMLFAYIMIKLWQRKRNNFY